MAGREQLVVPGVGGGGAGGESGVETWSPRDEGWLPAPTRYTLSQVEMALLIIR